MNLDEYFVFVKKVIDTQEFRKFILILTNQPQKDLSTSFKFKSFIQT